MTRQPARAAYTGAAPAAILKTAACMTALLGSLVALPAYADGYAILGVGRTDFVKYGCDSCHAHVSRRAAPSVRDLMAQFEGEPVEFAEAMRASRTHRKDTRFPDMPEASLQRISAWVGGRGWPEEEVPEVAEPVLAMPAPPLEPVAMAAPEISETPAPRALIVNSSRVALAAIRLDKGPARTDRLIVDLRGGEPDMIDMHKEDDRLIITLTGVRLGDKVLPTLANWPGSKVVRMVESSEQEKSVQLQIASHVAAWSYTGRQGKSRLTIDLVAAAKQPKAVVAKKPAPKVVAKATPKPAAKAVSPKAAPVAKAATPKPAAKASASSTASTAASAVASVASAPVAAAPAAAAVVAPSTIPPVQLAMAKPSADPAPKPVVAKKERGKKLKYRDGSNLDPCPPAKPEDQIIGAFDSDQVKEIMDRIGCPQCHAYVAKKTGPPFREVLKKYKGDPACVIHRLQTNETHNEEGVTDDIEKHEFKLLADYVASRFLK